MQIQQCKNQNNKNTRATDQRHIHYQPEPNQLHHMPRMHLSDNNKTEGNHKTKDEYKWNSLRVTK